MEVLEVLKDKTLEGGITNSRKGSTFPFLSKRLEARAGKDPFTRLADEV